MWYSREVQDVDADLIGVALEIAMLEQALEEAQIKLRGLANERKMLTAP